MVIVHGPQSKCKQDKHSDSYRVFRGCDLNDTVARFKVWGSQSTEDALFMVGENLKMAQVVLNKADKRFDIRESSRISVLATKAKAPAKLEYLRF